MVQKIIISIKEEKVLVSLGILNINDILVFM